MLRPLGKKSASWIAGCATLLLTPAAFGAPEAEPTGCDEKAQVEYGSSTIAWDPENQSNSGWILTLAGPGCEDTRKEFEAGQTPKFVYRDLEDGVFNWELELIPKVDANGRAALKRARETGDMKEVKALRKAQRLPVERRFACGAFQILDGRIVEDSEPERLNQEQDQLNSEAAAANGLTPLGAPALEDPELDNSAQADQVILDDLIVDGSLCVGFDCVNGENFGFDTIRLKENNLRIKFEDTSGGSFPSNDWQLTANASANGGVNKFSIDDITGNRTPFTVEARAPSHSLYVDDGGRLGLGTSVPVVDVHVVSGNSPTVRLEQNGSSGFAPQTWDMAGNETSFFIRDTTNGSTLPFRIRPGAPSQGLVIDPDGKIGLGVLSPTGSLHSRRTDGETQLLLEENSGTEDARTMMQLSNNGRVRWQMTDTSGNGQQWTFFSSEDNFNISSGSNAGQEFVLNGNGNLTITGMLFDSSDRNRKENFEEVDKNDILERLAALPITRWNYKEQEDSIQHIGPVAQDFHAAFGLGYDNLHIAPADKASVALASIQALYARLQQKERELEGLKAQSQQLETLRSQNESLLQRLEALEAKIQ
ncbi:MAG: tail fiber domain-containing protein [Deltaproteobacteria bacterium]|nr:tail fiber domain-containing protein [Deltaproteobacteria bacterium]